MNLANKLTMLRIFLVPIFLIFIAAEAVPYGSIVATVIFIIASLTDQLDGYIARSRNQITTFGKFMDPLADKLLVTTALISLVELQIIPGYVAIIIISREFAVSGLRTIAASEGIVIAASWWGKIKTVIQIVAIILMLIKLNIGLSPEINNSITNNNLLNGFFNSWPNYFMILAVIVTIISGIDYFMKNKKVLLMSK